MNSEHGSRRKGGLFCFFLGVLAASACAIALKVVGHRAGQAAIVAGHENPSEYPSVTAHILRDDKLPSFLFGCSWTNAPSSSHSRFSLVVFVSNSTGRAYWGTLACKMGSFDPVRINVPFSSQGQEYITPYVVPLDGYWEGPISEIEEVRTTWERLEGK